MPTFIMLNGSSKVGTLSGADPAGLEALVKKHAPTTSTAEASSSNDKLVEGLVSLTGV